MWTRIVVGLALVLTLLSVVGVSPVDAQGYQWVTVNGVPIAPLARITTLLLGDGSANLTAAAGTTTVSGRLDVGAQLVAGSGVYVESVGRSTLSSSADKLLAIRDAGNLTGMELNVGTPTLGTCTGGSLVSGAHNFGGEITGNSSGSCILNFGTPNFTNVPFCVLNDETNLVAARVSARSASSITITGLTSGDAVQYLCFGRLGT